MIKTDLVLIDSLEKVHEYIVGDNEYKTFVIFLVDGLDYSGEIKIRIKGQKANVQILGIILGTDNQKISLYTLQEHQEPESVSDLFIKSVMFDRACINYSGLIKIDKDAQKSNAYQKNQNLLMSKYARADSRPYLEILANDVRCTHGATIGKINKEQLYYLNTRGLTNDAAVRLILQGFYQEVIFRIPDKNIREGLELIINDKIRKLSITKEN